MTEANASDWYRDAVIYQLHVRAFRDSNGDGSGDFRGLVSKLDYLQDLGVTALWLLPFYPSPLKDDGYDIAAHRDVHPAYGTLRDFRLFLREAHARGLRVITEMVLNHTSDQHAWFQRARRAPAGSRHRNWYVWSDDPGKYPGVRVIFQDFEASNWTWDPVAGAYYWHRFYANQPDLNFDHPDVRRAMFGVVDFWLDMGVDGLRLDAVPYLFEREGTNCENLPETHAYLRDLRRHVDGKYPGRMLLAEANQWPEDAVAYFGDGDECHMAFHFPLMPRMFMAIRMEDRFPIIDILSQTPEPPPGAQWAIFLRNHDELTLEMVTDEERDYMYRVYASDEQARINVGIRRRLAPLLGNDRRLIEMMEGLLFSLPGTPVVYYGDEIGMGDNFYLGDRNGVRTPMQWSADRNAGFSNANPQKLYLPVVIDPEYTYEAVNVEAQQHNANSLLWHTKRLIALRSRHPAFGRGALEFLGSDNRKVLSFLRRDDDETLLVVANLSRLPQFVELDLSSYAGSNLEELLGHTPFPRIGELPYLLTLGPYAIYWFRVVPEVVERTEAVPRRLPTVRVPGDDWTDALEMRVSRAELERGLPAYLRARRWFAGKARRIREARFERVVPVAETGSRRGAAPVGLLTLVRVEYADGDSETYLMPLGVEPVGGRGDGDLPRSALARVAGAGEELVIRDGVYTPGFARALLAAVAGRRRVGGGGPATLVGERTAALRDLLDGTRPEDLEPSVMGAEQSNTSILFGERLVLKLFRRVEAGQNPDFEMGRFLTERAGFGHSVTTAGALELRDGAAPLTVGVLHAFVPNEGDSWSLAVDNAKQFLERALAAEVRAGGAPTPPAGRLTALAGTEPPAAIRELLGPFRDLVRLLGQRTAELHHALASAADDPDFAPEPSSALYQRSLYQSLRGRARPVLGFLRRHVDQLPQAASIVEREDEVLRRFGAVADARIDAVRIRCHGDFHLGQVLWTGKDFEIIDFEGEPSRPLGERRIKRSPLQDVAGLLRSLHYAAYAALFDELEGRAGSSGGPAEAWMLVWYRWVAAAYLGAYLETAAGAPFIPSTRTGIDVLLDAFLLEKAIYELRYEADHRPDWLRIPLQGVTQLLDEGA